MKRHALALVAMLVLLHVPARADEPDNHAAAVAEFTEGRADFERGDCVAASKHFQRSLELEQSVGARYSLADCAARAGNTASAWNHYKAAEQLAIKKADTERADLAHNAAAALDRRVVKVRLVLPAEEIVLSIDGVVVPATEHWLVGSGYAVAPDTAHRLEVSAKDARWSRDDVRGAAGVELPAIVVTFPRKEPDKPPPSAPAAQGTSPLRLAGFAVAGGGLLAAGGATLFAVLAASSRSDAKRACAIGPDASYPDSCNPARRDAVDAANADAQSRAGIATAATIASVALFATAGVLIFLGRPGTRSTSTLVVSPVGIHGRF